QDGNAKSKHDQYHHHLIIKSRQHIDGIPDGLPINDGCRRSNCHADERVQGQGQRQTQGLAENLIALRNRIARKVGNIERERGPESDHTGQGGKEKSKELAAFGLARSECGRLRKDRPESTGVTVSPIEKQETEGEEQW